MENVRWCGRRLLDGHAGSAIKVLVAIHYSVLDARKTWKEVVRVDASMCVRGS